jgi:ASPIC and UnbV/FG-GAP-like repeat/FlgD Ig-like domain
VGFSQLETNYSSEQFVQITWHLTSPWDTPFGDSRYNGLPNGGTPNAHFDYTEAVVGGFPSGSMYTSYVPVVNANLATASPLNMVASYGIQSGDVSVNVQIDVDQAVTTTGNLVYFVVIEDDVYNHDNMARTVLATEPLTITTPGQSVSIDRFFSLDPGWKEDDIEIVVFVQSSNGDRPVLQATKAFADYAGTIDVVVSPPGLGADWTLTGPLGFSYSGTDGQQVVVFEAGDYTLTLGDVPGWVTPMPNVLNDTLVQDGMIQFNGLYTGSMFTGVTTGDLGHTGAGSGVAMVDYDSDGDLDIHVVNTSAADLLLQNNQGVFTNVASGLVADSGAGKAAVWADIDNDGDQDFYLSKSGEANVLALNNGGTFTHSDLGAISDAGFGEGVALGDYNLDGLLDLYLCKDNEANILFLAYGALGPNWLFLAQGDVMADAGQSRSASWGDMDNDGDPDLYLSTWDGFNRLYDNQLTIFPDINEFVITNNGLGTGCAWGDYNNDGYADIYAAVDGAADQLIKNTGGVFEGITGTPADEASRTAAIAWGDYDNDGDLDLYQGKNGVFDRLLRNDGADVFTAIPIGVAETGGQAASAAWGDVDGDGDLDLYLVNSSGANVLLRNDLDNGNHWLHLRLTGDTSNKSAVGARARVYAGGVMQTREVQAGEGLRAQGSLDLEFGFGAVSVIDSVVINWPSGNETSYTSLPIDQLMLISENPLSAINGDTTLPRKVQLHRAYPNPFNPTTRIDFDLPKQARASLAIYDVAGRLIRVLRDEVMSAGSHTETWSGLDKNGRAVATGTYLLRLNVGGDSHVQRLTLVK